MTSPHRSCIDQLPAYALAPRAGHHTVIQLGQNELGHRPSPLAIAAARSALKALERYPDVEHRELRRGIADSFKVNIEQILCGAGSMELMRLLAMVYLEPGTEVIFSEFGYKYFQIECAIAGAKVVIAPERDFEVDVRAIVSKVTERTRMVYLANPGNPTGYLISRADIEQLRSELPLSIMLVLDCAYADFADGAEFDNGFWRVDSSQNIVLLRTFSKAYGLASLRVGWLYGEIGVVELLKRVAIPNSVTNVGLAAASAAVRDGGYLAQTIDQVIETRAKVARELSHRGLRVYPSSTNFLFVECIGDEPVTAAELASRLAKVNIIVRKLDSYGLTNFLRITIGGKSTMDLFLEEVRKILP